MTAYAIRQATAADAAMLAHAEREITKVPGRLAAQPHEIDETAIRDKIAALNDRGGGVFLVAEHAGSIVGHAYMEFHLLAVTSHVVRVSLAVHEGHQGRGVGRQLMNALLAWARSNPRVEKVELNVRSTNVPAVALYRSLGFEEQGRFVRRIKLGPGSYVDDLYMALWVGGGD